ncbi:MAG TPA: hypothetical protein VLU25_01340 [Acidobacteriota bacterium]|nr:hypothetical protein [Acidobacteriota bacterium]
MNTARWILFSLTFFLFFGLASQARHYPLVGVVTDHYDLTYRDLDRLEYEFDHWARRSHSHLQFRYAKQRRHYRPRSGYGYNRGYRDRYHDWDYTLHLDVDRGYYGRCGSYRLHYDWYVVDHYNRVIRRGHAHHVRHLARDVVRVIDRHWR